MLKLTMLMDNDALPGFAFEWGLSVAIELPSKHLWLWDCGKTGAFFDNAKKLGIDVLKAEGLAISHGHYDHTGGLEALREAGFDAPIMMHPAGLQKRWSIQPEKTHEIGIPGPLPNIKPIIATTKLDAGLTMVTAISRAANRFQAVDGFFLNLEGNKPDLVPDDSLLVIDDQGQITVVLGCCHAGLGNSLEQIKKDLGIQTVHTVVGGLHLFDADDQALEETAQVLKSFSVEHLFTGHCTGKAIARLQDRLDIPITQTLSGMVIVLNSGC